MKANSNIQSLVYAAAVSVACAVLLTFATKGLRPLQLANMQVEENRMILSVLDIPFKKGLSAIDIQKIKQQYVTETSSDSNTVFTYYPNGPTGQPKTKAYAFTGQGMWGPVKGFLSIDLQTDKIVGMRISHQEETPGLGSEISSPAFQNQFKGKSIVGSDGTAGIVIAKGKGSGADNEVDGITGATISGDRLMEILNTKIELILKEQKPE